MALVLVATPAAANANAYADVAEATDELAYDPGGAAWVVETGDEQIQDLVTGARIIDSLPLLGEPSTDTQALEFPRDGDSEIPTAIWKANILLALDIAKKRQAGATDVVNPVVSNVQRARSGDDEVQFFAPSSDLTNPDSLASLPLEVQRLLGPYIFVASELAWGSAPVVRTS
jgi:hypothetical protein